MVSLGDSAYSTYLAIARAVLFFFLLITLGITGYLVGHDYDIDRVNFGLAASILGLIFSVILPLAARFYTFNYSRYILLGLDVLSFILVLAAAAAVSDIDDICNGGSIYYVGSDSHCGEFKAGEAFLWLAWFTLIVILALEFVKERHHESFGSFLNFKKRPTGDLESGVPAGTVEEVDPAEIPGAPEATGFKPPAEGYTDSRVDQVPTNESALEHAATADESAPETGVGRSEDKAPLT